MTRRNGAPRATATESPADRIHDVWSVRSTRAATWPASHTPTAQVELSAELRATSDRPDEAELTIVRDVWSTAAGRGEKHEATLTLDLSEVDDLLALLTALVARAKLEGTIPAAED